MKLLTNPEVLRRLAAVVGLFTAIVLFLNPVSHVYKVELTDFAARHKFAFSKQPLDQFIAQKTEDRLKEVSGPEWQALLEGLLSHRQGQTPKEWLDNQPRRLKGRDREFYFGPDQKPFVAVAPRPGRVVYLALDLNGQKQYILLNPKQPEYAKDAPNGVLYPWRTYSWLPLVIGFALYFFLPKVTRPSDSLGYLRLWGLVISDFLGLAFAGFFFAFPLGMILDDGGGLVSLFDFERGWAWLTIIMWLLTGFGLFIMAIGVWYRNYWITFTPEGLMRHTYNRNQLYKYKNMEKVSIRIKEHHWLIAMLLIFGGNNPTALGQAAMLSGQTHAGVGIAMKNGDSLWIRLEAFEDPQKLVRNLNDHGVELDQSLKTALEG